MSLSVVIGDHSTTYNITESLAVGVSGGPDSMALLVLMMQWCNAHNITCHVLSVDHQLRKNSINEAKMVDDFCKHRGMSHETLKWNHDNPVSRIQESARNARYVLMAEYCKTHDIQDLFLAHHADDQMETVLFRLAKGTGIKGLGGMRSAINYNDDLTLHRPLLSTSKDELTTFCDDNDIPYINDPSNKNTDFARVRMRESQSILNAEGLTSKRLGQTAKRLQRADSALDYYADKFWNMHVISDDETSGFPLKLFQDSPRDIAVRILTRIIDHLNPAHQARMEKIENLADAICDDKAWAQSTLGGVIFRHVKKTGQLKMFREHPCVKAQKP